MGGAIGREALELALFHPLERTNFSWLGKRSEGKVWDSYSLGDGTRLAIASDRLSAFDRVLSTVPLKGAILAALSAWWFERTRDVAANHLRGMPDPNVLWVLECQPIPVEFVVRAYLTGRSPTSIWTHYAKGERRFGGHALPDGLVRNAPLPRPILTPSTKAPKGERDQSLSKDELFAQGLINPSLYEEAESIALALFERGQAICQSRGLILVDTKYEFGIAPDGRLLLIDELHTPDSSRFWLEEDYHAKFPKGEEPLSLDKEFIRQWLMERGGADGLVQIPPEVRIELAKRYIEVYERLVGGPLSITQVEGPVQRIERNLRAHSFGSKKVKGKVIIRLKKEVLDPQGDVVCKALRALGF
ncbi:MAG: phosphoribosylaminoimidazolesuccinocarboxamide synthase, partial [Sandaracinaceae bacterium]|nr:phosphoribosylaminoimidazolesuccinocarboxamide synthase [Sandaracinaceae bacterium]